MQSYPVTSEMAGYSRKRILLRILFDAGFFAASQILFQVIWPDSIKFGRLSGFIIIAAISGLVFALMFEPISLKWNFPYTLIVFDDCITAQHPFSEKSVRKDEVKRVTEVNGSAFHGAALQISKYGRLGTWLWGSIWIPKALPEYESVRDLALSWKGSSKV
jgi:hypothetical protein